MTKRVQSSLSGLICQHLVRSSCNRCPFVAFKRDIESTHTRNECNVSENLHRVLLIAQLCLLRMRTINPSVPGFNLKEYSVAYVCGNFGDRKRIYDTLHVTCCVNSNENVVNPTKQLKKFPRVDHHARINVFIATIIKL